MIREKKLEKNRLNATRRRAQGSPRAFRSAMKEVSIWMYAKAAKRF